MERYEFHSEAEDSIIKHSIKNDSGKLSLDLSVAPMVRALRKSSQTRVKSPRKAAPCGYWGDYRNADTPIWAFDNVIDRITETHEVGIFFLLCPRHWPSSNFWPSEICIQSGLNNRYFIYFHSLPYQFFSSEQQKYQQKLFLG